TVTNPVLQCTTATATVPGTSTLGDCTISNVPFGQYWVVEGTPPNGYLVAPDQNVVITRAVPTVPVTFIDSRNPATLSIHKQDDASTPNPLNGVVFTLYTDNGPVGPQTGVAGHGTEDTATTLTCTTGAAPAAAGDCTISNITVPGPYWVVETTPKSGYDQAPDQHVDIVAGGSSTTPLIFSDARNF